MKFKPHQEQKKNHRAVFLWVTFNFIKIQSGKSLRSYAVWLNCQVFIFLYTNIKTSCISFVYVYVSYLI